jgi:hypothetical protein
MLPHGRQAKEIVLTKIIMRTVANNGKSLKATKHSCDVEGVETYR